MSCAVRFHHATPTSTQSKLLTSNCPADILRTHLTQVTDTGVSKTEGKRVSQFSVVTAEHET